LEGVRIIPITRRDAKSYAKKIVSFRRSDVTESIVSGGSWTLLLPSSPSTLSATNKLDFQGKMTPTSECCDLMKSFVAASCWKRSKDVDAS
jgi:hypothetical protein